MNNIELLLKWIQEDIATAGKRYNRYSTLDSDYGDQMARYYGGVIDGLNMVKRAIDSLADEEA